MLISATLVLCVSELCLEGISHFILLQDVWVGSSKNTWLRPTYEDNVRDGCVASDPCTSRPCPPNAQCINTWQGYECRCDNGFYGDECSDVCDLNPCSNNATCIHDLHSQKGYRCECPSYAFSGGIICKGSV